MAKSKWHLIEEKLPLIIKWCRDGLSEDQIMKNIGIKKTAFSRYKNEREELRNALKKGKEVFITEIENALSKRALGFEYEETKTYIKYEDGKEVKYQERTKKYYPPDVAACSILLKNKDRGNWSDNPMKIDLERELMEFKKEMERMKVF
jgi:replicative superfamily II helicase